jgi:hypothetical protein
MAVKSFDTMAAINFIYSESKNEVELCPKMEHLSV